MARGTMIQYACFKTRERDDGRSRDESVEQHGNWMAPRRQNHARDSREFAPAERHRHAKRIAEDRAVKIEPGIDRCALAHKPGIVDAGAAAGPPPSPSAKQCPRQPPC